jgi:hypothetical protein
MGCFRTRGIFAKLGIPDFEQVHVQVIGAEESYGQHAIPLDKCPREVSSVGYHEKKV